MCEPSTATLDCCSLEGKCGGDAPVCRGQKLCPNAGVCSSIVEDLRADAAADPSLAGFLNPSRGFQIDFRLRQFAEKGIRLLLLLKRLIEKH